jgi:hypothetical protein
MALIVTMIVILVMIEIVIIIITIIIIRINIINHYHSNDYGSPAQKSCIAHAANEVRLSDICGIGRCAATILLRSKRAQNVTADLKICVPILH